jgi:hypothetical protein
MIKDLGEVDESFAGEISKHLAEIPSVPGADLVLRE